MKYKKEKYTKRNHGIVQAQVKMGKRVLISIPMTGLLRAEWAIARWCQGIPTNWSHNDIIQWMDTYAPMGFLVADARNTAVKHAVEGGFEWLFFIDHDVVMPFDCFSKWNQRMLKGNIPIWGALYFTKSVPSEPLIYRELGSSYFKDWKLGDEVWCGSMGLGCNAIHRSILEVCYNDAPEYEIGNQRLRRVFETPIKTTYDAEKQQWATAGGTEDITWYTKLKREKIFAKAGWKDIQRKEWPILCDTSVFCRHIDWQGVQYPSKGEEQEFAPLKLYGKKV